MKKHETRRRVHRYTFGLAFWFIYRSFCRFFLLNTSIYTLEIRRQIVVEGKLQQRNQTENSPNLLCIKQNTWVLRIVCVCVFAKMETKRQEGKKFK